MQWRKSPEELVRLFDEVVPDDPRVERRKMFGYPAAFANGNLFCGLHQESLILKLDDARRDEVMKAGGTPFEPMPGRTMREYVVAPAALLADRPALKKRIAQALECVASLPAKTPKKTAAKKKKKKTAGAKGATSAKKSGAKRR